jgi:hypothetical protein
MRTFTPNHQVAVAVDEAAEEVDVQDARFAHSKLSLTRPMLEMLRKAVIRTRGRVDDELAQARERERPGRAGVVPRRHPAPRRDRVGSMPQ